MDTLDDKYKVLIVDDIPQNLQILGSILSSRGIKPIAAINGTQALMTATHNPPDLILLDIMMPEMDGFEVCKRLKASHKTKDIPVIFLTARSQHDDIVRGFELGAVDFVTKPFNAPELLMRVQTHLELKRSRDTVLNQKLELEVRNVQLQQLNATKDKFFSIVAHDLKNPFNSLMGFSELLVVNAATYDAKKISEFSEIIFNASAQAYKFLNNLLDWARTQTGQLETNAQTLNLAEVVSNVVELLEGNARQKKIEIVQTINATLRVNADRNILAAVLRNLISNAIKFTHSGTVSIKAHLKAQTDKVQIDITDSGIGMDEEKQKKLFKIDGNISTEGTQGESGTGLGLILCKEFVERSGGEIWVESTPDVGSTFSFTILSATDSNPTNKISQIELVKITYTDDLVRELLSNVIPLFDLLQKKKTIKSIKEFSEQLCLLGERHSQMELLEFGRLVQHDLEQFEIGKIQKHINHFQMFIDKVNKNTAITV